MFLHSLFVFQKQSFNIFPLIKKKSYFDTSYYINSLCLKPELLKDGYKAILFYQANTQKR